MHTAVSNFLLRMRAVGTAAGSRDLADVLPAAFVGPAMKIAAALLVLTGLLDILHYSPRY